jgi:hypothetical protein
MKRNVHQRIITSAVSVPLLSLCCLGSWVLGLDNLPTAPTPAQLAGTLVFQMGVCFLLIPLNKHLALIRSRLAAQCFFYLLWAACLPLLQPLTEELWLTGLLLTSFGVLLLGGRTVHGRPSTGGVYHAFLLFGVAVCLSPALVQLLPLYVVMMLMLQIVRVNTVLAAIFGLLVAFVGFGVYRFAYAPNDILAALSHFTDAVSALTSLPDSRRQIVSADTAPPFLWYMCGLTFISVVYYGLMRTYVSIEVSKRITLLLLLQVGFLLFLYLHPESQYAVLPLLMVCAAFTSGHFFSTVYTRFTLFLFLAAVLFPIADFVRTLL